MFGKMGKGGLSCFSLLCLLSHVRSLENESEIEGKLIHLIFALKWFRQQLDNNILGWRQPRDSPGRKGA